MSQEKWEPCSMQPDNDIGVIETDVYVHFVVKIALLFDISYRIL